MLRQPFAKTSEWTKPLHAPWHDCGAETLVNAVTLHDAMLHVKMQLTEENGQQPLRAGLKQDIYVNKSVQLMNMTFMNN